MKRSVIKIPINKEDLIPHSGHSQNWTLVSVVSLSPCSVEIRCLISGTRKLPTYSPRTRLSLCRNWQCQPLIHWSRSLPYIALAHFEIVRGFHLSPEYQQIITPLSSGGSGSWQQQIADDKYYGRLVCILCSMEFSWTAPPAYTSINIFWLSILTYRSREFSSTVLPHPSDDKSGLE